MADLTRAEELVQTIDRDATLREAIHAAPTVEAKRQVLDDKGFQDVGLDDMRAFVESKGGTMPGTETSGELTEQELEAVSGGADGSQAAGIIVAAVAAA